MWSLGMGKVLFSSIAFRHVSVPSSCGMFRYRFETSMVTRRASCGILVCSNSVMSSEVLLRRDGILVSVGFR